MLTVLLGTDWIANRDEVLKRVASDVAHEKAGRIIMVPELISHDMERRLCAVAGDTASRFAEVLSFSRLCRRVSDAVGHGVVECMDNGGRIVAMASSARQLHSRLKAYAAVETKPEFLGGLVDAVDEFKRCCITPADMMMASKQTEGSLAQKLEELSLLLETYDSHCQRGKRDPRDQMTWLLEQLEDSNFAAEHVFYIDGFPDFTRQHMAILEHLIVNSPHVIVSLNCDRPGSNKIAFEKAGKTAADIIQAAKRFGVALELDMVAERSDSLRGVRNCLFQGPLTPLRIDHTQLRLMRSDSVYDECVSVAQQVLTLVREGARYRDIGIACADFPSYRSTLSMVFRRCGLPVYLSGTEDILEKPVITTVLAALDAALGGFEVKDVLRYAKSVLSPLELEEADILENYVILWSVNGSRWLKPWTGHPGGLGEEWTESAATQLAFVNSLRIKVTEPLENLHDAFSKAVDLRGQVEALYGFLCDIQLAQRLDTLAKQLESDGDGRNAQILNQLWDILINAIEQLYDVLGETVWDAETFSKLLRLLLSQYDVGTIPAVLDSVCAGPVDFMRCQQTKHLFVMGAQEGSLPGYSGSTGVLTDQERTALRSLGVPLTGGAMDGLQAEFAEIYGVFCGAEKSVTVSCPSAEPSFVYKRLVSLAGEETKGMPLLGAAMVDPIEAGAYLSRFGDKASAEKLGLEHQFDLIQRKKTHTIGKMSADTVRSLYGKELRLSASQVDLHADCRFSYFLKYGLRAKELKAASVDPAEFGTYVHAVLEDTVRKIMELGGFEEVSMERALEIARDNSAAYAQERFKELESERTEYLFRRNSQELEMILRELWLELHDSAFHPIDFEVGFGNGEKMPAVNVSGKKMKAVLRGFVDRVDAWQEDGRNYFRVVDYKTGRKDFDYCDVFNGLGLQMLLYLFALEQGGECILGKNPIPAGVQYFPARAPLVAADGLLSQEEADAERERAWKRKGLILSDDDVLHAMEPCEKPKRLNYKRSKDGAISGDIADREQFRMLRKYVFCLLGKMVDEIASGTVEPNPYTRGSSHNACAFCPYGSVCHASEVEGRRNYQAMSSQRFWEEIGKELSRHE